MEDITVENTKKFFDNFSKNYDEKAFYRSVGIEYLSCIEKDFILKSYEIKKNNKILDLGVGTGRNIELFLGSDASIFGLDISKDMIEKAKNKFKKEGINFKIADISKKIPFKKNTFDLAICIRVLKYIPTWKKTIKEVSRVLKKDGLFLLEVSNKYSVAYLGKSKANYLLFKPQEITKTLEENNLKIINMFNGKKLPFLIYSKIKNKRILKIILFIEKIFSFLVGDKLARNKIYVCRKI